jgi:hypothetical protein
LQQLPRYGDQPHIRGEQAFWGLRAQMGIARMRFQQLQTRLEKPLSFYQQTVILRMKSRLLPNRWGDSDLLGKTFGNPRLDYGMD